MYDRATMPSAAKVKTLINATLFSSEMVTGGPTGGMKMAASRLIYPVYGGESPGRAATEWVNKPQGLRDGSPGMVSEFSHTLGDKQWVPSDLDEHSTQTVASPLVTMKWHTYNYFC